MAKSPAEQSGWPPMASFGRWAKRNIGLRVLSLLIAIGLWVFVNAGQKNAIESLHVPISYRRLPADMVIVNQPPEFAKIQVTGPRTLLSLLDPEQLEVKLDLSGIGPGEASFKINPTMFNVPRSTTVTSVSPAEVVLDVDRVVQRDLPIHVDVEGQIAQGYRLVSVQTIPPKVTAIGPSRFVTPLQQVSTEPFDVQGAAANIERRVDLESPNPAVALTAVAVAAKVTVKEKIASREFRDLPIDVRDSDYKFRVIATRASVVIRGPELKLEDLDRKALVYVEAKGLAPGSHDVAVQVDVPDGMKLVRQSPQKVKIRLYHEKLPAAADEHAS
jgi:YbbR domain-containing protein